MRTVNIIIDEMGGVKSSIFAGHAGEHNAVTLSVEFEQLPTQCTYFRMIFSPKDGQNSVISTVLFPQNGKITYPIPKSVTTLNGPVAWQLCGYVVQSGEYKKIVKSAVVALDFGKSLADTVTGVDTDLEQTVEQDLKKLETFMKNFNISTRVERSDTLGLSAQNNNNDYQLTLKAPTDKLVTRIRTVQTDYEEDQLFGNKFGPVDKTNEYLIFEKVGNVVTVCGSIYYDYNATRNQTGIGINNVVLYLPYVPERYVYISASGTSLSGLSLNPSKSALVVTGTLPEKNDYLRLCFSYICKEG